MLTPFFKDIWRANTFKTLLNGLSGKMFNCEFLFDSVQLLRKKHKTN